MTKGYIELHQSILDEPIWTDATPEQKVILMTLLTMANDKERPFVRNGKLVALQPGQIVTTLPSLVNHCGKGISEQKIRTALKRFAAYGILTVEATNKNRLITILDSGYYRVN